MTSTHYKRLLGNLRRARASVGGRCLGFGNYNEPLPVNCDHGLAASVSTTTTVLHWSGRCVGVTGVGLG